uniref:choice-of-anchor L domain-containing protein n=1 Tax=Flavobacterium sp. TaxID=239 RepID=UPI002FDAE78B
MKKKILSLFFVFYCICSHGQLIVNNTAQTPAQLVQSVLLGDGVTVSNITFNGSALNASQVRDQVGFFSTGVNPTNLGLDSGIILATGNAQVAVGPNNANGATNAAANPIAGDPDLAALASGNIRNVAILEFDFVPTGTDLSFRFVFGSEEYPEYVDDTFNDVFGFFLSGPGITGPYSGGAINIALVPFTSIPIAINNVNGGYAPGCPTVLPGGANSLYYVNNCGGATIQYDGFTTDITARAEVQCGQTYHIKLAIANVVDNLFDSAVFIQANSFGSNPVDLGADLVESGGNALCEGQTVDLDTTFDPSIIHEWYLDGVLIPGETGPTYTVTEGGTYTVIAYPFGNACPVTDSIFIEYYPPLPVNEPIDLINCEGDNIYNLTQNDLVVLGNLGNFGYTIDYALSSDDGLNGIFITNPTAYPSLFSGQTVYAIVFNTASGNECSRVLPFQLISIPCGLNPQPTPLFACDDLS